MEPLINSVMSIVYLDLCKYERLWKCSVNFIEYPYCNAITQQQTASLEKQTEKVPDTDAQNQTRD